MSEKPSSMQEDYSGWYNRVIREANLIKESPTRGVWTLMPRSNRIWNTIRHGMTEGMNAIGVNEVTMPTLFPMSLLEQEAEHVDGFAPEVFTVTKAGSKELEDPLVVRPTSEVVVSELMRDEIESYRDLPYMINQWTSAFRAEKRPRPFLRTTEFLWQEGHSAHATPEDADEHARRMAEFYKQFMEDELSLAAIPGEKSDNERFPGAVATYALEGQFGGRALQLATSHNLGNNFALSHNIVFSDQDGALKPVYQTSWGSTTRLIGALVMGHGDDGGIVLPPQIAPEQVTVIPAWRNEEDRSVVDDFSHRIAANLGSRAVVARRELGDRLGAVRYATERTGSPLQLIVGQREIDSNTASYKLRHSGETGTLNLDTLDTEAPRLLGRVASELLQSSREKQVAAMVFENGGIDKVVEAVEAGKMVVAGWAGDAQAEQRLKDETGITIRIHPDGYEDGRDPLTGESGRAAIFAKSY
ncbi:MAG: aminoacyl--tRNA ligase-related protein [Candidatus Microsaccharimonas sp.]